VALAALGTTQLNARRWAGLQPAFQSRGLMSRLARQGRETFATWATRANGALRPSLASVDSRSVVAARRGGSELSAVAVPRRRGSRRWVQAKGSLLTELSRLGWGRVVPLSGRRLRWRKSGLGGSLRGAVDGGRASQWSEFQANGIRSPGWSRVRHPPASGLRIDRGPGVHSEAGTMCVAIVQCWQQCPRRRGRRGRRTSIPRRPESSSFRSKVLDSLLFDGSAAAQRPGLVRRSPAKDSSPCPGAGRRRSG
jgi:hypothetical protein